MQTILRHGFWLLVGLGLLASPVLQPAPLTAAQTTITTVSATVGFTEASPTPSPTATVVPGTDHDCEILHCG